MASSNLFSSLPLGYNAESAFANLKKSGPRSCSFLRSDLSAFAFPLACKSMAAWTRSRVVAPCLLFKASSETSMRPLFLAPFILISGVAPCSGKRTCWRLFWGSFSSSSATAVAPSSPNSCFALSVTERSRTTPFWVSIIRPSQVSSVVRPTLLYI